MIGPRFSRRPLISQGETANDTLPEAGIEARLEYFEAVVRPVFARRCYDCHSTEKGLDNGGLILDTTDGIAAGGSRGKLISTEDSGESSCCTRFAIPTLIFRCPEGKLPDEEIAIFERWVKDGAALPQYKVAPRAATHEIDYESAGKFWLFQPLNPVSLPTFDQTDWVRRPLDTFILARLNEHKLNPNPEADRATLLRRVTFDVIGLPPSTQERDAFINDQFARCV